MPLLEATGQRWCTHTYIYTSLFASCPCVKHPTHSLTRPLAEKKLHTAYCVLVLPTTHCILRPIYCILQTRLQTEYCVLLTIGCVLCPVSYILHTVYGVLYIVYRILRTHCILYTLTCLLPPELPKVKEAHYEQKVGLIITTPGRALPEPLNLKH